MAERAFLYKEEESEILRTGRGLCTPKKGMDSLKNNKDE